MALYRLMDRSVLSAKKMSQEDEDYWRRKAESLERKVVEDRQTQHLIVAMFIGVCTYGLLGLSYGAGAIGFIAAAIYYAATKKKAD